MNTQGSILFYGFMLGLTILILGLALAPAVKEQIDSTRNPDGLNCTNPLITNFDKATCYVADLSMFYFIGGVIFIAGAIVTARILFE